MPLDMPRIAYLVSTYPAVSHTFILREIRHLRALGHDIVTASINPPDRAVSQMEDDERAEADATYVLKRHGPLGALQALLCWLGWHPRALLAALLQGWRMGRAGGRSWYGLAYAVEAAMVARWMRAGDVERLHVHFGSVGAAVGVLVKVLTGCHLSITIHGPDEFDEVTGQQLALKLRSADAVICISQFAKGQLMRIGDPADWGKLHVCRLGVTQPRMTPLHREPDGNIRLLCVGRLTPAKGQLVLVRALARLRDAGLRAHLTLVGAGPDRPRIEAALDDYRLRDQVTLTGALTPTQVRARLDQADIFVLPSLAEGIPVALMEAMAAGVPCVTTPVNGIPELIEDGRSGLLATPGSDASLAEQLARLMRDASLRRSVSIAARAKVLRDFDLERNVAALSALFHSFAPSPDHLSAPAAAAVL